MNPLLWVAVFSLCGADQWSTNQQLPDCHECKQVKESGANFSSMLLVDGKVVVGAKNAIYHIDFHDASIQKFQDERVPPANFESCIGLYGQNEVLCQNYYKVIIKLRNQDLFICGTEAFKPSCSVRSLNDLSYSTDNLYINGICPASPYAPTSYLKLKDTPTGFSATTVNAEYTIQRIDLKYGSFGVAAQTKEDNLWLNVPDFVYSFEDGEYVYFLFKEIATEDPPERVYSRVARICKNDDGSRNPFYKNNFLTFVKARLYCSYTRQGSSPHTFDSISGAYFMDSVLYVLFTSSNSIVETGSVLCLFTMDEVTKAFSSNYRVFDAGQWKDRDNKVPFTCSTSRSPYNVTQEGHLMSQKINSKNVLQYSELELKTVTAAEVIMNDKKFVVLHTGSSNGEVLKIGVMTGEYQDMMITSKRTYRTGSGPVTYLERDPDVPGAVYVMSHDWITYIPLDTDCARYSSCQQCQASYPLCGWCYESIQEVGLCSSVNTCNSSNMQTFYGPFDECEALPEFKIKPSDTSVDLNGDARIYCSAKNNNNIKKWYKMNGHLSLADQMSDTLTIEHATDEDNGCYECKLVGVSGSVTSEACLFVRIPPSFIELPTDNIVTVVAGKDALITCHAIGNPEPKYSWYKTAGQLPEGFTVTPEGDLKLIRVINNDAGQYQCRATNDVSTKLSPIISLKVIGDDPDSYAQNGRDSLDITMILVVVGAALLIIIVIVILAHVYCRKVQKNKFIPLGPEDEASYNLNNRFTRPLPTSSLPTHLHADRPIIYNNCPDWQAANTIGVSRPPFGGTHQFITECSDQPPPPYQPLSSIPTTVADTLDTQHEYDEIHIMRQPVPTNNGYHSTFRLNNAPCHGFEAVPPLVPGRSTPPQIPGRCTPPQIPGRCTPPQMPGRCTPSLYDRMNSPHRTTPDSPASQWANNSDI